MNTLKIKTKMMSFGLFLFVFTSSFLSSCVTSIEDHITMLESYLASFKGQRVRDVVNEFGYPTKYINRPNNTTSLNGTMMMYDYPEDDCTVYFTFQERTQEIIDWDYDGNCMMLN